MRTPARSLHLEGKVDGTTIDRRKRSLMALQRRVSRARNRSLIGEEVDVLVQGLSEETDLLWKARMSTQAPEIDGICYINDFGDAAPQTGEIRRMRITEAHDYDLVGALTDAAPESAPPAKSDPFPILATTR